MTYPLQLTPTAARHPRERLPEFAAAACAEFIMGPLADNPHRVGAPLRTPFEGDYRARRGEYRVRYRIDDDTKTVFVLAVHHRRDAYRRR
ncbi:type II toxin-antitoxin system RelE family toxin [Nocardiopsis exhalans]|uniref:type II toxin-antitoxin system RelE family toxin n=1 Tax=Nocardiopsis exhalans TaxID=163604 RepID=UPI00263B776E|nr:type II toxin-antitoxin system RelE/ParE family toxin [Nocardiopsis exhalans]